MKYRIIPNKNGKYKIQYKKGLFWKTVKAEYALEFDNEEQAELFIKAGNASATIRADNG